MMYFHLSLAKMMIVDTIPRKNKATNPNCIHCSDVGFFQIILDTLSSVADWVWNAAVREAPP